MQLGGVYPRPVGAEPGRATREGFGFVVFVVVYRQKTAAKQWFRLAIPHYGRILRFALLI